MQFPAELKVKIELKTIEVDIPKKLVSKDVKDYMGKWELQPSNKITIEEKRRTQSTFTIKGGTPELRLKYLITLLEKLDLYKAPEFTWDLKFLQNFERSITDSETKDSLYKKLDIEQFEMIPPPTEKPKVEEITQDPVIVGTCTASYLIYTFAREEDFKYFNDSFNDPSEPAFVIQMKLPIPIFVSVLHQSSSNNYKFAFMNYNKIKASTFKNFFMMLVNNMEKDFAIKMTVEEADPVDMKIATDISAKYGFYVSAFQDLATIQEELARSFIYVLSKNGENDKPKMEEAIKEIFETIRLYYCKKCKSVYPISNKVCYRYYHEGKQIPFPDGEMEIVDCDEVDEYDEPIVYQNWTCCGEIPECELGCKMEPNGAHERDMKHKEISSYKIEQVKYSSNF